MEKFDAQQICLNGHQITTQYHSEPLLRKNFCKICGAKTIYKCPNCDEEIQGAASFYISGYLATASGCEVPEICEHCGKDFPWRGKLNKENKSQKNLVVEKDAIKNISFICNRFSNVVKQLQQRHEGRTTLEVKDEYDVQDLLHSLLGLYFDDIRPEEYNPSYAGSSTRSDFLLHDEYVIIEVKKTRLGLRDKELGKELIIDIAHYRKNPRCRILYCFVYDPDGLIKNPKGLENDLSEKENDFEVIINIVPKFQKELI